jgi:hypothetical protein
VHSLEELKQLLLQSIHRSKWVVEELFETSKLEAKGDMKLLQGWLMKILDKLKPYLAGETPRYYTFHCPFHAPDRNPSFVINKLKFYAFDYHNDEAYSLKQLAERLGVELSELEEKAENSQKIKPCFNIAWKRIHPTIDAVNGTAYVGVDLPCEITKEGKTDFKEFHFLVGSDRTLILCQKEELNNRRIQLSHAVVRLPNRWSLQGVEMWLKGEFSVKPEELYIAVKTAFETYIEFEDSRVYDFLTLWTIGTYFFHLFNAYPYLYVGGTKQSGKTKLLTLLSLICHNAIFSNNISTASAFRLVQSGRCTLLMDETEKLNNPDREIDFRNMLYAGYKKGALVYRTHKDTLKPEPFEVYSPKAIANIRGIEDVLEDRCITLILKRGKNLDIVNREIQLESEVWQQIRDMLYVFYLQFYDAVGELSAYNEHSEHMSEALKQRELELWKPILTLALFFEQHGGINDLFKRILEFAKEKAEEKEVENRTETLDFILVQTLDSLIKEDGFYRVKSIKEAMALNFDEPQKWLTTKWIGNALRRLGFTVKRRFGSGYEYYFSREKVTDLTERLGISETHTHKFTKFIRFTKFTIT